MWSHGLGGGLKVCDHTVWGVDLRYVATRSGGWT